MDSIVHEEFVKAIKNTILEKEMAVMKFEKDKVVSILTDILCLGREAVYRRLRGDVKFSLEEVTRISLKLGISIDTIIGLKDKEKSVIDLDFVKAESNFVKEYHLKIDEYSRLLATMNSKYGDVSVLSAFNRLPYIFYLHLENIAKFRMYKWAYQMRALNDLSFKSLVLPQDIIESQTRFVDEVKKVREMSLVLSSDVFASFVNDINYFRRLGLVDDDDIRVLKHELMQMLKDYENYAVSGSLGGNSNFKLYISDLDLNFSNMVFKYSKYHYTYVNIFDLGGIESHSETLCAYQGKWVNAMKRCSKLISESNEIERYLYFEKQKSLIDGLI